MLKTNNLLIILLLFTLTIRLIRLDYPNKYVFDEVYHAFTAKEYLALHKEAWEWWTTPPEGVAYEWTHPPLTKEIMAVSMLIFHSTEAWAWRLPGSLLGVLTIYLVYLLGMQLLKNEHSSSANETASLIAAFVFSLDGLNFVQSRIGMNDIYYITFVLASLLFLLRKKYVISAITFGLAISSKWAAIYFLLIILFILFKNRQLKKFFLFMLIPTVIYFLSYIPFFFLGHNLIQFIQLQQQMWWYHTGLKATHSYSSAWWSWPLNLYPVWYFVDYQKDKIANIFASGNTTVFWVGTASMVLTGLQAIKKRSLNSLIIVLGFLIFWLPWAFSPRIMFLYHFSPSIPFLSLSLGHQLAAEFKDKKRRRLVFILLALILINFLLIFPFLTGIPIPKNLVKLFFLITLSKDPF